MAGMTPSPGESPKENPGTDGTEGTDSRRQEPPRPRARPRTKLAKVEERLNEMFATIAIAQAGLGVFDGDPRHMVGAQVTEQFGPQLVGAWVKLAQENPRVEKVLLRMAETSAWGEVILATGGFVYSQAQVYGAVPPSMPNPWVEVPEMPPPPAGHPAGDPTDPRSTAAAAGNGTITGRQAPTQPSPSVRDTAEAQRRQAEEQRLRQARGQ
jgi:hypothetical protein